MTTKLLLAILATLSCGLIGHACAGPLYRRARTLERLCVAMGSLNREMLDAGRPIGKALLSADSCLFEKLVKKLDKHAVGEAWRAFRSEETMRNGCLDCLAPRDLLALDALFSHLGATGREDQRRLLEEAARTLNRNALEAQRCCGEKDRLYSSLGLLCGLALTCLFF